MAGTAITLGTTKTMATSNFTLHGRNGKRQVSNALKILMAIIIQKKKETRLIGLKPVCGKSEIRVGGRSPSKDSVNLAPTLLLPV